MTAAELAALHRRRVAAVPREFGRTSRLWAIYAVKFTREKMTTEIYAVPVDKTKAGKPKWRRTGHLRRSERAEVVDPYTVRVLNDAAYAEPRHEAGKPGHRAIDPRRVSHWRDDLRAWFETIAPAIYQETVKRILETK